jgi:predicted metal-dependent phosphoesterase TrpH
MNFNQNFDAIHEAGGLIVHAHPFAEAWWIQSIQLLPRKIDAVEVYNACTPDFHNENAQWYANRYGFPCTGGSDIHHADQKPLAAVETETPCETVVDLFDAIKARKTRVHRFNADELLKNPLNAR